MEPIPLPAVSGEEQVALGKSKDSAFFCDPGQVFAPSFLLSSIKEQQRNEIIIEMAKRDIACNVHYKPLPMHTAYKKLGFDIKDYPNAYAHFANEISLPLHTCLTDEQVDYVIACYQEIVGAYIK